MDVQNILTYDVTIAGYAVKPSVMMCSGYKYTFTANAK